VGRNRHDLPLAVCSSFVSATSCEILQTYLPSNVFVKIRMFSMICVVSRLWRDWPRDCNIAAVDARAAADGSFWRGSKLWGRRLLMADKRYEGEDQAQSGIEGKYANYFQIGHNAFEFLLDFGQMYADGTEERFHTRIVTGPSYAKELLKVLNESIEQYEATFGSTKQDKQV